MVQAETTSHKDKLDISTPVKTYVSHFWREESYLMIKDICSTLNQLGYLILCNGCYYLVKLKTAMKHLSCSRGFSYLFHLTQHF